METSFKRVDASSADWLRSRRIETAYPQVANILPEGYDSYLRVFHPFEPWGERRVPPPTWRQLAQEAGAHYGPELTWEDLEPVLPQTGDGRPYAVDEGELDFPRLNSLLQELAVDGDEIFYYFGLASIVAAQSHQAICFRGDIESLQQIKEAVDALAQRHVAGPEYLWNERRTWIVSTDYDLTSTYVACDRPAAQKVLNDRQLEVVEVEMSTPLSKQRRNG